MTNKESFFTSAIKELLNAPENSKLKQYYDEIEALGDMVTDLEDYSNRSVGEVVRDIYDLSQSDFIDPVTNERTLPYDEYRHLLYMYVEELSDKLGINLEEPMRQQNRYTIPNEEGKQQNRLTMSKDERLLKILKNISEYAYTEDKHIKETLDARLMNDYLELADILGENPEKYI